MAQETKEITVTLTVKADSPARMKDKIKLLESFANLKPDDAERMTQIMTNEKALRGLAKNWNMLKMAL